MLKLNKDDRSEYNPNLLLTGGIAAIGGLVIYAAITWLISIVFHLQPF